MGFWASAKERRKTYLAEAGAPLGSPPRDFCPPGSEDPAARPQHHLQEEVAREADSASHLRGLMELTLEDSQEEEERKKPGTGLGLRQGCSLLQEQGPAREALTTPPGPTTAPIQVTRNTPREGCEEEPRT